jgi:hypothetical protein
LICWDIGLAVIPSIDRWTAVNDLNNGMSANTTDWVPSHAAHVGDSVAFATVVSRARRTVIACDRLLAVAVVHVDGGIAETTGYVGRDIASSGAVCTSNT